MGFFDKLFSGLTKTRVNMEDLEEIFRNYQPDDDEFFDELEELLIMADMGADTVDRVVTSMHYLCFDKNVKRGDKARELLIGELEKELDAGDNTLKLNTKPSVILMVGVNGVGKTTTIGKLAAQLKAQGKKVLLVAGDTFRAAAAEQLGVWAERAGADFVRHEEGSDPAAVVFDGISAGKARGTDVIIIDTAGRLHNKQNLMNELSKMRRIIARELPDADVETLMVLDATTGQNGLIQAEQFLETAGRGDLQHRQPSQAAGQVRGRRRGDGRSDPLCAQGLHRGAVQVRKGDCMITSKQRAYLRSLAMQEDTIVQIGKGGITDSVIESVSAALKARELVKGKVLENSMLTAREACDALCEACKADGVQVIGTKFVLFKRNPNDPKIELKKDKKKA